MFHFDYFSHEDLSTDYQEYKVVVFVHIFLETYLV